MTAEPIYKRAIALFDGQNLFYAVKLAFGHKYPNYDPVALAKAVCGLKGWDLVQTRFYTGIPDQADNPFWNHFWTAKLAVMGTRGVVTYQRSLRYRPQTLTLEDGTSTTILVGNEKGIDVRIALDTVRLARENAFDVAVIFSQDQDLSEVAEEIRAIARDQGRCIQLACAFPVNATYSNTRGIEATEWIKFDKILYDQCIDPLDYRPKKN